MFKITSNPLETKIFKVFSKAKGYNENTFIIALNKNIEYIANDSFRQKFRVKFAKKITFMQSGQTERLYKNLPNIFGSLLLHEAKQKENSIDI